MKACQNGSSDKGRGRLIANQGWNFSNKKSSLSNHTRGTLKNDQDKSSEKQFLYGNFHRYYGYRNEKGPDVRLSCLKKEWLTDKDVLDIGCNAGHFTLAVARDFSPRLIIGMDIDPYLVRTAKKNIRNYLTDEMEYDSEFPISCISQFGPLAMAAVPGLGDIRFPFNISFVQGNYVFEPESASLLEWEKPKFDTIFCLSVTKWIQLNWGDEGLKRLFFRIHAQLRNGGRLILEPQPYRSYHKKKKLSYTHLKHFNEMQLYPEGFNKYLLEVVGFKTCQLIDIPSHRFKGFSRPLYLFTKGNDDLRYLQPKHIIFDNEDSSHPSDSSDMDTDELSD